MRDSILARMTRKGIAVGPNKWKANNEVMLMDFLLSFGFNYSRSPKPADVANDISSLLKYLFGETARIVTEDKTMSEDNPQILKQAALFNVLAQAPATNEDAFKQREALRQLFDLNPFLVNNLKRFAEGTLTQEAADRRQMQIEEQLFAALVSKGYTSFDHEEWNENENPVLMVEGSVKDFCANIAADLVNLFGAEVQITIGATTIINNATIDESRFRRQIEEIRRITSE